MQYTEPNAFGSQTSASHEQGDGADVNYYRVLDVDPNASRMTIREAYLRLKNAYGSGSAALYSLLSEDEATAQLAQIEAAFRVLSDDVSRRAYDKEYGIKRTPTARQGAVNQVPANFSQDDLVAATLGGSVSGDLAETVAFGESTGQESDTRVEAVIRTTRSMLPIVKLKAPGTDAPELKEKLFELLQSADPGDGDLLRRMRETCGVSEEEISERTKVSIGYIQAIEANRFDRLPQAVFVKGFLRSYCRFLDLPEGDKLVAAFSTRLIDWQANRKG